jgi:hypothetical protein
VAGRGTVDRGKGGSWESHRGNRAVTDHPFPHTADSWMPYRGTAPGVESLLPDRDILFTLAMNKYPRRVEAPTWAEERTP